MTNNQFIACFGIQLTKIDLVWQHLIDLITTLAAKRTSPKLKFLTKTDLNYQFMG